MVLRRPCRTPDGTLISTFDVATDDRGSDWIAFRPDGCTMVYTSEGTRVLQYDVCAARQTGSEGSRRGSRTRSASNVIQGA